MKGRKDTETFSDECHSISSLRKSLTFNPSILDYTVKCTKELVNCDRSTLHDKKFTKKFLKNPVSPLFRKVDLLYNFMLLSS